TAGANPRRPPVLQRWLAAPGAAAPPLLWWESPTRAGAPRHNRVRNIGEFLTSSGVSGVVAVQHDLHVRPDVPEGPVVIAGLVVRSVEQCARLLRDDASLEKEIGQCCGRLYGILGSRPL